MASFLDSAGVTRLVTKLKTIFAVKATTLSGYGITNGVSSVSVTGTSRISRIHQRPHPHAHQGSQPPDSAPRAPHIDLHPGLQLHQLRGAHPRPHRRHLFCRGKVLDQFPPCRHHARIRPLPWVRHHGRAELPSPSEASRPSRAPSRSRPPRSIISRSAPMGAAVNIWPRATSYGSASRPRK